MTPRQTRHSRFSL